MTSRWDGRAVADGLLEGARAAVRAGVSAGGRPPRLVSVHRGGDSPFQFYLRRQAKNAERVGIEFREELLPEGMTSLSLRQRLATLDQDPGIDAVLLEHPLPPELGFLSAASTLRLEKDVDGVGAASLGRLVAGQPVHAPAVARGAILLARHYGADFLGRRVAVVGRSETVGLPLALLLAARGLGAEATVTIAHSRTRDLAGALAGAEVVFSAAGVPGLLNRGNVPEGAAVVDVGLSSVPDPTAPSGHRGVGDADASALDGWARALTPVPGGVGPMTVAALMENTVQAWALLGRGQPT
ncbi:MAG TPA: bifunctional 5,10-methylenetetrahydrofolate dehydrogenase/5,10-methenyltetrahydrofolate cyclohydrolase [Thermoplasmata archaeon]|nr:bifunctional 5,10-methylenetetrahydrofolate dehydrogenase/5,10-methenyltetrahydrofolate cyclohydrolase [Thermoplasmata archaeon]